LGRRSDHNRTELRAMILTEGHRQMSEVGYAHFSAREVAKRIGYSIGTIYNVFGTHDALILAINGQTLDLWRDHLLAKLASASKDRLNVAVEAYFEFAILHRNAWTAIYDFRLPENAEAPEDYAHKVKSITDIVVDEVAAALPAKLVDEAPSLARSLLACVHGHCFFTLNGTFRILGEMDPLGAALKRVDDAIAAIGCTATRPAAP
jgi:AcrR family transcriptional regulator